MNIYSLIVLLILYFVPSFLFGQEIGKWRAGSANKLEGNVYTISCFISDTSNEWQYDEKVDILKKVDTSANWLTQQAAKNNTILHFSNGTIGLTNDIKQSQLERGTASGKERVDLISLVLAQNGYNNPIALCDSIFANTKCKNVQILLFAKGNGNGYSMTYSSEMNKELYFVEGAILYEKYWNNYKLAPASIAHEILHLYAAWDFYKTFQQSEEHQNKAMQLFPNSIMLRTAFNIDELNVDEVTALLVGWSNSPKEWYESFRPNNN
ncbi:hypothetical protein BH10BAC3_BH10BAC3_02540 [soil metagenome]